MENTQGHKSLPLKIRVFDPAVVRSALTLELLAPQSHPHPLVEFAELRHARREPSPEVTLHAPHQRVQFRDDKRIQIMAASGDLPHFRLEVFHRLRPHLHRVRLHVESQKGEPFQERRDL